MRKNKPKIAVTGPDKGGTIAWIFTKLAIWRAGGKAIRLSPSLTDKIPNFDGLILGGGADIDPNLYSTDELNEARELSKTDKNVLGWLRFPYLVISLVISFFRNILSLDHSSPVDSNRDTFEEKILKVALEKKKPVLGICRGAQFINVYFKGNLHKDISPFYDEFPKVDTIYPKKEIDVDPDSKLGSVIGSGRRRVNSLHNQAVYEEGKGIKIVAQETATGIPQAIETDDDRFIIGIQWHPEYLPQMDNQQNLFKELVKASRND